MYRNASYTPRRYDGQAFSNRSYRQYGNQQAPVTNFNDSRWVAFREVQPVRAAWIEAKAASFDFAASMFAAVVRFGDLTERQAAAVDRCAARDQDRAQQVSQPRQMLSATFPRIRAAFDAVVLGGARKAQITVGNINLSLAPSTGRNAGALYVKDAGIYVGKIVGTASGPVFYPTREAPADLVERLLVIEADPTGAVRDQAARTAAMLAQAQAEGRPISLPCGCCGITLTDPVSIARGIGPICASKWGF